MADLFHHLTNVETPRCVSVMPERGLDRADDGLTYALPPELTSIREGQRVIVPLGRGNKPVPGWVLRTNVPAVHSPKKIKTLIARDTTQIALSTDLIELARWVSSYYVTPLGLVLANMVPAPVRRATGLISRSLVDLAPGIGPVPPYPSPKSKSRRLSSLAQKILSAVAASPRRPVDMRDLATSLGLRSVAAMRRLVKSGLLVESSVDAVRVAGELAIELDESTAPRHVLTADQQRVLDEIRPVLKSQTFSAHVLMGPTASGKTEVYLRLAEEVAAQRKSVLILVPDLSLTPQMSARFVARFGDQVAFVHSGISASQRHEQWGRIANGERRVVVGARSSVFAPFPAGQLGLLIVDEEHDASYKHVQAPRYHARDVSVKRAQLARCPVLLGSATPSLETYANANSRSSGAYVWHELTGRVPGVAMPRVEIVDVVEQQRLRRQQDRLTGHPWRWSDEPEFDLAARGDTAAMSFGVQHAPHWRSDEHLLTPRLEVALARTLALNEQAIILLNRRGYAAYIACSDRGCGWYLQCDDCDAAMTFHQDARLPAGGVLRCHHCLRENLLPEKCPKCGKRLTALLFGTQRLEEELCAKFPGLLETGRTLVRVDSDSVHRTREFHDIFRRFRDGQLRVLVGTQTITKGHDFPGVTLVGVIHADTALHIPDFRATERTFQFVTQAAGRSGRAGRTGVVIVQTMQPHLPAIQTAARHDYRAFADAEMEDRRRSGLPPATRLVRLVIRDRDHRRAHERAQEVAVHLRDAIDHVIPEGTARQSVRLIGPAPCHHARIAGHYRIGIEVLAPRASTLQALLATLRSAGLAKSDHATAIDVDPIDLL